MRLFRHLLDFTRDVTQNLFAYWRVSRRVSSSGVIPAPIFIGINSIRNPGFLRKRESFQELRNCVVISIYLIVMFGKNSTETSQKRLEQSS